MTYKKQLEQEFASHNMLDKGHLHYSRVEDVFFYSKELETMCAVVAQAVDNVITVQNVGLLEKYIPGSLDEMVRNIAIDCSNLDVNDESTFLAKTIEVCHTLHTIAYAKMLIKQNTFER